MPVGPWSSSRRCRALSSPWRLPSATAVAAGDAIVTLEAMKMEHGVVAPVAGRLAELRVAAGDQVTRGQVLGVVEP